MPPLTRQQTIASIHSWWSDSNPGIWGPTINLHAATKPLMRLMYHRQAIQFIEKSRGTPLSTETVEILSSYLPHTGLCIFFDQGRDSHGVAAQSSIRRSRRINTPFTWHQLVKILESPSSSIKTEALDLVKRLAVGVRGAVQEVDEDVLHWMTQLLGSPSSITEAILCDLVRNLARHDSSSVSAIWHLLCVRLVPLLRHEDIDVIGQATLALSEISRWPNGAEAVVKANWSCLLIGALANHERSALTVSASGLTELLVPCLHDDYTIEQALYALEQISRWPYGARAVADAKADYFMELLKSRDATIQRQSCELVGIMAGQRSIASDMSESKICVQLVSLLRHRNTDVVVSATAGLVHIAKWEDGAPAVVAANALHYVRKLFISQSDWVRIWACRLLGNLASHTSTGPATLDLYLFPVLTSLLRHKNVVARTSATFALARLSDWPNGKNICLGSPSEFG
ncbi:armadillo-type protein [Mycena galericulata]|nr:armadillo-type protein [Mycena galericulata]